MFYSNWSSRTLIVATMSYHVSQLAVCKLINTIDIHAWSTGIMTKNLYQCMFLGFLGFHSQEDIEYKTIVMSNPIKSICFNNLI